MQYDSLNVKADVTTTIRTHCRGCGITYSISMVSEPMMFFAEENFMYQIKTMVKQLIEAESACTSCGKKTKQVYKHQETL